MGLFDRFKKKRLFDKEGNPIAQVVIEEKDMVYTPCPGEAMFLENAPLTGPVPEEAAGMVVKPSEGVIFAPLTGDVSLDAEHNEIRIENFLDVKLLIRVLPLELPVAEVTEVAEEADDAAAEAEAAAEPAAEPAKAELKLLVSEGAHVHVGDPLATFDVASLGENASVVVLVENANEFAGVQPATDGEVEACEELIVVLRF